MGITKTLARVTQNFMWQGIKDDVRSFILYCLHCQQTKYNHRKSPDLLCPLPVLARPWEDLSLNFIGGLPSFRGFSIILVVVDRFSKGVHLGMLHSNHTASTVAHLFLDIVVKIHGMPHSLVFDRDPLFLSKFWQELFKLSGTKLRMSSAYHPQSDGQTEVLNRVIEQYLQSFVHQRPSSWGKFLLWAEWPYNTSIHTATGMTPYEVTFGKKPSSIPPYLPGTSNIDAVDDFFTSREAIFAIARKKLLKAQHTMKHFADNKRREVQFKVGDMVLVKLWPRRQTTVTGAVQSKLAKRYYGPFCVLEKIGPAAYHLELPLHSRIHPVFHCLLLKPFQ